MRDSIDNKMLSWEDTSTYSLPFTCCTTNNTKQTRDTERLEGVNGIEKVRGKLDEKVGREGVGFIPIR